jgi:hypothetical protein
MKLESSINTAIKRLLNNKPALAELNYQTFNGSPFPFIGPEWIDIDFNLNYCFFSIIPKTFPYNKTGRNLVGFCEDIKFDHYPSIMVNGQEWINIKLLLVEALSYAAGLTQPGCKDIMPYFYNLNMAIQALAANKEWTYDSSDNSFTEVDLKK